MGKKRTLFKRFNSNHYRVTSWSSDDIATPPPNVWIGSLHFQPNLRWCVIVSRFACDDRRARIAEVDSSPPASNSDTSTRSVHRLQPATDKIGGSPPMRISALEMMSDVLELGFVNRACWIFLAACTRLRIVSEDSLSLFPLNFS